MQIKKRPSDKHKDVTVEIDVLTVVSVALIILLGVLLLFTVVDFLRGFLEVKKFEIVGDDPPYLAGEVAEGAGIEKGDNLYRIDRSRAEKEIIKNCAYIEKVDIRRSFPNKIKFVVECYEPIWYIEISGDFYVLDENLRVLEETKNEQRLYESDITKLTLPSVKKAIVGEEIVFGGSDVETEATLEIMQTILSSPIRGMMSSADIDNRYDIHFEFDSVEENTKLSGKFVVSVGGYSKLETKLEYIARAIAKESFENVGGGTINVSEDGDKVSIRPEYVYEEQTETETAETAKSEEIAVG